jgi:hypothetical protein
MNGQRIRDMAELTDGSSYVCSSGDPYKAVSYNKDVAGPGFKTYSKVIENLSKFRIIWSSLKSKTIQYWREEK